jgi:hypothetical protein
MVKGVATSMLKIKVEVVFFGYSDYRVDETAATGFVMRFDGDNNLQAHFRRDIESLDLPDLFGFTLENLPHMISQKWEQSSKEADTLYSFIQRHCLDGVGSFRYWSHDFEVAVNEIPKIVIDLASYVDEQMGRLRNRVAQYKEECSPRERWGAIPATSTAAMTSPTAMECSMG